MQNRICKFLRYPTEAYTIGMDHDAELERMDHLEIDLCIWLTERIGGHIPPALNRRAGGGVDLRDGDCDLCDCFEPVSVPTVGA